MSREEKSNDAKEAQVIDGPAAIKKDEELDVVKEDLTEVQNALASVNLARIKTSYSCASKLAIAGIISNDEVDAYAEQMLNDNLKSDAMIRQTKLLLKSAQSSAERVVAAAAEKMSVRTASTNGISTTPALSSSVLNSAAYDIQSALKGTWTMPKLED